MKQNLLLAMAHLPYAQCMIMDEPFNELDPSKVLEFKETVRKNKEKGVTQILSTHQLSLIQDVTDLAFFLKQGKLTPIDIKTFNQTSYQLMFENKMLVRKIFLSGNLPFEEKDGRFIVKGDLANYINAVAKYGVRLTSCQTVQQSLEDAFKEMYI